MLEGLDKAPSKRPERVAEAIRGALMDALLQGGIRDPRLQGAHVAHVSVTRDLSVAKVYMTRLEPEVSERQRKSLLAGCAAARGRFQRYVAERLSVRRQPELRFLWDAQPERAERIEALLAEDARDEQPSPEKPSPEKPSDEGPRHESSSDKESSDEASRDKTAARESCDGE